MGNCGPFKKANKQAEKQSTNNFTRSLTDSGIMKGDEFNKVKRQQTSASTQKRRPTLFGPSMRNDVSVTDVPTAIVVDRKKTHKDLEIIRKGLSQHFLFNSLSEDNLKAIVTEMKYYTIINPNEIVFLQGDDGHNFFIVASGKLQVIVDGEPKSIITKGNGFGEMALMHNSKRSATIKTLERSSM